MKLDFTGLNQIAYRGCETTETQAQKDQLVDQGCRIIEDEPLPFDDDPPAAVPAQDQPRSSSPAKVEIRQVFSLQDVQLLCKLSRDGKIELLEKIYMDKQTGFVYAHFMLIMDDAHKQASEAV